MEQLLFFPEAGQSKDLPTQLLDYRPNLIPAAESDRLLKYFIDTTPWKQTMQKLWDKEYLTPRLTCWYGHKGLPWTPELQAIRELVEPLAGIRFNSFLLNYYRDGNDSVAWHSDKDSIMGSQPVIASVSFGQVRSFDIRRKNEHAENYSVKLEHGSFLLMKKGLQEQWEHRIAKSTKVMKPRINLTFRLVLSRSAKSINIFKLFVVYWIMENRATRYSDADLKEFKDVIESKLSIARDEVSKLQRALTASDSSATDNVLEDGAATLEKESSYQMLARQKKFIEQLEGALQRIANKTYGICKQTGELIQKERLLAVPHTTLSMAAKMQRS